jgi:hypothetical protein
MPFRRLSVLLFAAIVCAVALAGCGEMSKAEYEKKADKIGTRAESEMDSLFKGEKAPTPKALRKAQTAVDDAANDMDDLSPPSKVKTPHERMVRGLKGLAEAFGRLADDLDDAKSDDAKAKVFLKMGNDTDAKKAFNDLSKAEKEFKKAGYTVFSDDL